MTVRSLTEIRRQAPEAILSGLLDASNQKSAEAGLALVQEAASFGLSPGAYLRLAADPKMSSDNRLTPMADGLSASFAYLNLPTREDRDNGVTLQLAAQTFATYTGSRALFPEFVDTMVRFSTRSDQIEQVEPVLAGSRSITAAEVISTVIDDGELGTDAYRTSTISQGARIPIRKIVTSQSTVAMFKHGSGYEWTYEFARRANVDIFTPYAARIERELQRSKLAAATGLLVNGDSTGATGHGASPVTTQSSLDSATVDNHIHYMALIQWLVKSAQAAYPIDTVVGNYDAYIEWLRLFATPNVATVVSPKTGMAVEAQTGADALGKAGIAVARLPVLDFNVNFVISSSAPAGKLIGLIKNETIEELVEANANIAESERAIRNQTVTYVRSEVTGYRLVFGSTRRTFDFTA